MSKSLKFANEILPLLVFFITYKFYDLITASLAIVVITAITLTFTKLVGEKIPLMPLISAIFLGVFGGLTFVLGDTTYIKLKPTIVSGIFSIVLFFGYFTKRPLLKYIFSGSIELSEAVWLKLTLRWGIFFLGLAIINELVWRNFSESFWVNFKVFGILAISFIFTISQMPIMMKTTKN